MDKLKFVKIVVFLLTFSIVFLLCLAITKVVKNRGNTAFSVELDEDEKAKISQIFVADDNLYIVADDKYIHILNIQNGTKIGTIYLSKGNQHGKKEEKNG